MFWIGGGTASCTVLPGRLVCSTSRLVSDHTESTQMSEIQPLSVMPQTWAPGSPALWVVPQFLEKVGRDIRLSVFGSYTYEKLRG